MQATAYNRLEDRLDISELNAKKARQYKSIFRFNETKSRFHFLSRWRQYCISSRRNAILRRMMHVNRAATGESWLLFLSSEQWDMVDFDTSAETDQDVFLFDKNIHDVAPTNADAMELHQEHRLALLSATTTESMADCDHNSNTPSKAVRSIFRSFSGITPNGTVLSDKTCDIATETLDSC